MKVIKLLIIVLILSLSSILYATGEDVNIGSTITFAGRDWRVLDLKDGNALVLSMNVVVLRPYLERFDKVTWTNCSMRSYLNNDFLNNEFTSEEKARLVETRNVTVNPWFPEMGSATSIDKVFLLSVEEVVQYFGDSGDLENRKFKKPINDGYVEDKMGRYLSDQYNAERIVKTENGRTCDWWLRSNTLGTGYATYILSDGAISVVGLGGLTANSSSYIIDARDMRYIQAGVRPAMWIKL